MFAGGPDERTVDNGRVSGGGEINFGSELIFNSIVAFGCPQAVSQAQGHVFLEHAKTRRRLAQTLIALLSVFCY